MAQRPFNNTDSHTAFRSLLKTTLDEIRELEADYVLKASATELEQFYVTKVSINPLVLHADQRYIDNERRVNLERNDYGRMITVGGTLIRIAIPYEGDKALWHVRPSTYGLSYPELEFGSAEIAILYTLLDGDSGAAERMKSDVDRDIGTLLKTLAALASDVEQHNRSAADEVRRALAHKRKQAESTSRAIASLGIPVRKRGEPLKYTIPAKRKPSPVARPRVATEKYAPEPELPAAEFDFILGVIKSMALVMERDPASFAQMDEPAIRTHFLLQLNGHYEGGATGETFNAAGKTDILIRVQDRNVFIAECKFWDGPKSFSDAVDQLLGYLSWRDSKCALLIFNQRRDTSAVQAKMHEVMTSRAEFRKTAKEPADGEARYVFVKPSDPGREIHICTMLFDVPSGAASKIAVL
jgi:hypothetical protein